MARSLDQILAELQPGYAGSESAIKTQQDSISPATDAAITGLQAQLTQANDQILAGARQRNLGYSGIPVAEQAKYAATEFAPAVAKVKQSAIQQQTSLGDALSQLNRQKIAQAQGIQQSELNRDEQIRQFNESMAAQERQAARAAAAQSAAMGNLFSGFQQPVAQSQPAQQAPSLQSYLAQKYSANPTANRATQDSWVKTFAVLNGANPNDARLWAAYDQMYPWAKYNDQARAAEIKRQQQLLARPKSASSLAMSLLPRNTGAVGIIGR